MSENVKYPFCKTATITYQTDGGTNIDVGHLQNVEIRATGEQTDLFAADSIKRQDVFRHSMKVSVKAEVKSIDHDLLFDILSPTKANVSSQTLSSIEDVSQMAYFDVIATLEDTAGKTITITVRNVVFKDLPILVGTMGEWVSWTLEGEGNDVTIVKES